MKEDEWRVLRVFGWNAMYMHIESFADTRFYSDSDVLHPNLPNLSKSDLREKLSAIYKSSKDQVSVFGLRTRYGGGMSSGFALVYDSVEALKKFEPHYRLVRIGAASKVEKASRQQRTYPLVSLFRSIRVHSYASHRHYQTFTDLLPFLLSQQASSARTDRRSSAALPRPRARRRARRTNKPIHIYHTQCHLVLFFSFVGSTPS